MSRKMTWRIISGVVLFQSIFLSRHDSLVCAYPTFNGNLGAVLDFSPQLLFRLKPAEAINANAWKSEKLINNRKKRFKREKSELDQVFNYRARDNAYAFGMAYTSIDRQQFLQEREEFRKRNGGFLPPSACPERRPYIFYCDPRHRTGPINPATGQPWPNGIYFPPQKQSSSTISTLAPLLRPPCDSILCPLGGNEGYGYTGLENVVERTKQQQHRNNLHNVGNGKDCGSLLCITSSRQAM